MKNNQETRDAVALGLFLAILVFWIGETAVFGFNITASSSVEALCYTIVGFGFSAVIGLYIGTVIHAASRYSREKDAKDQRTRTICYSGEASVSGITNKCDGYFQLKAGSKITLSLIEEIREFIRQDYIDKGTFPKHLESEIKIWICSIYEMEEPE